MPLFVVREHPGFHPGAFSVVPSGLDRLGNPTQDFILGYSQPSLRDCSVMASGSIRLILLRLLCCVQKILPRISSWATLSRPCGTVPLPLQDRFASFCSGCFTAYKRSYPGFHPGLLSAVLRDCSVMASGSIRLILLRLLLLRTKPSLDECAPYAPTFTVLRERIGMAATAKREISKTTKPAARRASREVRSIQVRATTELTREAVVRRLSEKSVRGRRLRALFDEWRATGVSTSGEEQPFRRDIAKTRTAWARCQDFIARNPPEFRLGNGVHFVSMPAAGERAVLATFVSGDHAPEAMADIALGDFIGLLSMPWCFDIARCAACTRYFAMGARRNRNILTASTALPAIGYRQAKQPRQQQGKRAQFCRRTAWRCSRRHWPPGRNGQ